MQASNKLREALKKLIDVLYDMGVDENTLAIAIESPNCQMKSEHTLAVLKEARAALASPQRNCDVGTPREQNERFVSFCASHYRGAEAMKTNDGPCDCPCWVKGQGCNCFVWAQMPYKEGGGK